MHMFQICLYKIEALWFKAADIIVFMLSTFKKSLPAIHKVISVLSLQDSDKLDGMTFFRQSARHTGSNSYQMDALSLKYIRVLNVSALTCV